MDISNIVSGDLVKIVDYWHGNCGEASNGEMDHWLGQIMTVRCNEGDALRMEEDISESYNGWYWFPDAIECVVQDEEDNDQVVVSDEEFFSILNLA